MYKLLESANANNDNEATRLFLARIKQESWPCQIYAQRTRRLNFTFQEDKELVYNVCVDVFHIDKNPSYK